MKKLWPPNYLVFICLWAKKGKKVFWKIYLFLKFQLTVYSFFLLLFSMDYESHPSSNFSCWTVINLTRKIPVSWLEQRKINQKLLLCQEIICSKILLQKGHLVPSKHLNRQWILLQKSKCKCPKHGSCNSSAQFPQISQSK